MIEPLDWLRKWMLSGGLLAAGTAFAAEPARSPALPAPAAAPAAPATIDARRVAQEWGQAAPGPLEQLNYQDVQPLAPSTPLRPQGPTTPNTANSPFNQRPPTTANNGRMGQYANARRYSPVMIGDFFGSTGGTIGIPNAAPVVNGSIPYRPVGGSFGESSPLSPSSSLPAQFGVLTSPINGVIVPNTVFNSVNSSGSTILNTSIGSLTESSVPGAPGSFFLLDSGDPLYKAAREQALVNQLGNGQGTAEITGGRATLSKADGDTSLPVTSGDLFFVEQFYNFTPGGQVFVNVASPSVGGGGQGAAVGRLKIAENMSPMPRDRVFFNYSHFDNVPLFPNGVDVNRYSPGFEKTFFDSMASFEMRVPFAGTLDNDIFAGGATDTNAMSIGNMSMILKTLVYTNEDWAFSTGLGITVPTAEDVHVFLPNFQEVVRVNNDAVHLLPFLGALYTPNERFFAQSFLQLDLDTNGNQIQADTGAGLTQIGRINDATFLFADVSAGYWIVRDYDPTSFITGVAPTVELHYARSLQTTDAVSSGLYTVGNFSDNIEVVNAVVGTTFEFGLNSTITAGYTIPLASGSDKQFDGEFRALLNIRFGALTRRTRAF